MSQQVELRDAAGKLLGHFIPVDTGELNSRAERVFESITEPTEIRDPAGKVLGTFTPAVREGNAGDLAKYFDRNEVERRKQLHKGESGRPLREILRDLESRENPK